MERSGVGKPMRRKGASGGNSDRQSGKVEREVLGHPPKQRWTGSKRGVRASSDIGVEKKIRAKEWRC